MVKSALIFQALVEKVIEAKHNKPILSLFFTLSVTHTEKDTQQTQDSGSGKF